MIKFWRNRDRREKILIAVATLLFLVIFFWLFIVKPVLAFPEKQQRLLTKAQSDLVFMRQSLPIMMQANAPDKTTLSPDEIHLKITQTAVENGLTISRRQPGADGEITLWLENIDTVKFYGWVENLTRIYNISLIRANVGRNEDGTANVQISFSADV